MEKSNTISGTAFLLGSVLCWGAVPVLLRSLTGSLDAWTANGFRYPLSAVIYWPVLIMAYRSGALTAQTIARCTIPALLALGGQVFWALSPYYLPAGAISFFVRFSLLWSLIAAMILFADERRLLTIPRFYLGILLTVSGFAILATGKLRFDEDVTSIGIVIILICSVFFGFYAVSVRQFLQGIHPVIAFGVVSQIVSAGTLFGMFSLGQYEDLLVLRQRDWIVLVGSSILGIALGHAFLYSSVRRLGAAVTSGAQTTTPFFTAFLAAIMLGESMSGMAWIGGVTMVAGALTLILAQNQLIRRSQKT